MAKLYPFSMVKHGHDLELARNALYNRYICNDAVSEKLRSWAEEQREKLAVITLKGHGHIAWLTGEELGLAKRAVGWATTLRISANDELARARLLKDMQGY